MAMTSSQHLGSILQAEKETATQLLTLLKNERASLTETDPERMDEMTAQKQPLIVRLEQLSRQRESFLQAKGFPIGKDGLDAFIANQTPTDGVALKKMVSALRSAAQGCREHNQINGGIVNVNRQYIQKAMSILRGSDTTASSYGPGGEYSNQVVQQPLIGRV